LTWKRVPIRRTGAYRQKKALSMLLQLRLRILTRTISTKATTAG